MGPEVGGAEHPVFVGVRVPLSTPIAALGLASFLVLLGHALLAYLAITGVLWGVTFPLAFSFSFAFALAPTLAALSFAFLAVIRK